MRATGSMRETFCKHDRTTHETARTTYRASAWARFIRSHAIPCRVVLGRKRGQVALRVASLTTTGWMLETIRPTRAAVLEYLGY